MGGAHSTAAAALANGSSAADRRVQLSSGVDRTASIPPGLYDHALGTAGTHPRTVMQIVGHTVLGTTIELYGHVNVHDQRAALDLLDQLLDRPGGRLMHPTDVVALSPAAATTAARRFPWAEVAPPAGLEPATLRLTAACSAN